jgi:hypothetical protein
VTECTSPVEGDELCDVNVPKVRFHPKGIIKYNSCFFFKMQIL